MTAKNQFIAAALEEHFGPHKPPDLTDSILARGANAARSTSRLSRRRWFAAAMLFAGLGIVALVPLLEVLRSPVEGQDPDGSYLPLSVGATWEYTRTTAAGRERVVERATGRIRVGERDVYQILRLVGDQPEFRYIAVDSQGIWRYPGVGSPSMPGLREGGVPVLEMVFPLAVGDSWRWTVDEPVTGATIAVSGAPYPSIRLRKRAIVVGLDEEVTVPAGTFSTAHLRIETTEADTGPPDRVEYAYYAPGVGVVTTSGGPTGPASSTHHNLVSFSPGSSASWAERLPTALAKHRELADRGMPDSFERIDLGDATLILESRFATARWGGDELVLRFRGDRLSVFDRTDLEDWTGLVAEEPLSALSAGSLPQASTAALAELAGRLHAIELGLEIGTFRVGTVMVQGSAGRQVRGTLSIVGDDELTCEMHIDNGRVVHVLVH